MPRIHFFQIKGLLMMHDEIVQMFDLSGKVALVVGGARNLGFDMASVFAAAGSSVIITSRSLPRAQEGAKKLNDKYGVDALGLALDHTDPEQVAQIARTASQWRRRIDILVNNAGGGSGGGACRLFERSAKDAGDMIENNLTGSLHCCREIGRIMADQGYGKIINIASIAGIIGRDRRMYDRSNMQGQPIDYSAAKGGVIAMTKDLAAYLAPMGVYVNCISPGGFARELPESFIKNYSDRTPLGRMGRDGIDLKGAALFLASSASDYVTGHNLVVDGGFTIWQ